MKPSLLFRIGDQFEVRGGRGQQKLSNTGNSILSSLLGLAGNWNKPSKQHNKGASLKTYKIQKPVQKPSKTDKNKSCRWSSKLRRIVCHSKNEPVTKPSIKSFQCPLQKIPNGKSMIIRKGRIHRYKCSPGKQMKGKRFQVCTCAKKPSRNPQNCDGNFVLSGALPVCY